MSFLKNRDFMKVLSKVPGLGTGTPHKGIASLFAPVSNGKSQCCTGLEDKDYKHELEEPMASAHNISNDPGKGGENEDC